MADDADRSALVLTVWPARHGWWSPMVPDETIDAPPGWVFVASGSAGLTRRLTRGPHWIVMERDRRFSRRVGILAPEDAFDAAEAEYDAGAETRKKANARSRRARWRAEERYQGQFSAAVVEYLAFAPEHASLAQSIARAAAEQACEVRSRRVGRTGELSLDEAARLAVRAHIRHAHTEYERDLTELRDGVGFVGEDDYADVRRDAAQAVDRFIARHRTQSGGGESTGE